MIDETGDRKKGKKTDYVARQYLGSVGKVERGIVSVNAYGISENITFPLLFKVFKPKGTLKATERYQTQIEPRYIREIIFGKRKNRTYWEITTDPETLPANSTSFVMTNLSGNLHQIKQQVGNLYGLRTWVEYGFKQCQQELGWTDYRFTQFEHIERWWEIIFSVYLMVSLQTQLFTQIHPLTEQPSVQKTVIHELLPPGWNSGQAWKNSLNNIRLLMRPLISLWLISPWLEVFPNHSLLMGFHRLIQSLTQLHHYFSSA